MGEIKAGSIVKCNSYGFVYYNLKGLVYKLQNRIASVVFEGEDQMRGVAVEFLTPIGEIEPWCMALNYRPGSHVDQFYGDSFDKRYFVDHIGITPSFRPIGKDTVYYKVSVFDANGNSQILYPNDKIYTQYSELKTINVKNGHNGKIEFTPEEINKAFGPQTFELTKDNSVPFWIDKDPGYRALLDFLKWKLLAKVDDIDEMIEKSEKSKEDNNMCMSKNRNMSAPVNPIEKVIFNDPATIVFWKDGTKTIVKCQEGAEFDFEKGLAMAISRHYLCDICHLERYDGVFKRHTPREDKK